MSTTVARACLLANMLTLSLVAAAETGVSDPAGEEKDCGCSSGGTAVGALLTIALALVATRRQGQGD